jgi:ribA/ribD-fused uncharacterized protein
MSSKYNYICFWGADKKNGYLSNFFLDTPFIVNDIEYFSSEHYFMETKAATWPTDKNKSIQKAILATKNPKDVKALGRQVEGYNEEIWDKIRFPVMKFALQQKFSQNPKYLEKQLDTRNSILVEASPFDAVWGIGMNEKYFLELSSESKENILKNRNLLGKALMEIRELFS